MKTDVVIVGAGPTGLALACQFARYGVDFVVIEKNPGVTPYSKAIGVQARTLELYEQLGIAKDAVDQEPRSAHTATMLKDGRVLLTGGMHHWGTGATDGDDGSFRSSNG